ncbi:hypothetical protein M8J76_015259 [Diaphorina citri]|nr:hypothetical protein M8J76_015259 [Diaphorina citri]
MYKNHLKQKLNQEFEKYEELDVQGLYDKIVNSIKWSVEEENKEHKTTDRIKSKKLSENTKELIMKREELNKKLNKTERERIEHAEIRKLVKREIKKDIHNYEENIIKQIMETTKSTKNIKKELNQNSKCWIKNIEGQEGKILYDRREIIEEATRYYEELYHDPEKTLNKEEGYTLEEPINKDEICVLNDEVEAIIKELKKKKAPGIDNITNELIIAGKDELVELIAFLFTEVLCQGRIPKQWEVGKIILLHKKDRRDKLTNYRPITLSCVLYKMFMKMIQKRLARKFQENQPSEQAGFRPSFSTIDHIHSVNQIIEKSHEYNVNIYISFVDYKKAFDSIKHSAIWDSLKTFGIEPIYIRVLKEIYNNTRAFISLDRNGRQFNIQKGVRQGCPWSADLFNGVLETIFRDLRWETYGLSIDGRKINHLRFADDVVLFSDNHKDLEHMVNELREQSLLRGLEMNISKTKVMTNSKKEKIILGQEELKYEETYTYLGQNISIKKHLDEEIHRRINLAWGKYWALKKLVKGKLPPKIKGEILQTCIFPTLIYGCQAWAMNQSHKQKIASTQNKMMRSILNIKLSQKIRTKNIENRLQVKRAEQIATELKFKWAGHMMRTNDNRWSKSLTEWIPRDKKRNRGRQRKRWKDEIVEKAGKTWTRRTQNREEWKSISESH